MKPFKINAFLTYVLYVMSIICAHKLRLTFVKMASSPRLVLYCLKERKVLLERLQVRMFKLYINKPRMAMLNKI